MTFAFIPFAVVILAAFALAFLVLLALVTFNAAFPGHPRGRAYAKQMKANAKRSQARIAARRATR